ncbi:type II toxin-antitoxin system prevent-host-death family antitoxin [Nocardia takedensis]
MAVRSACEFDHRVDAAQWAQAPVVITDRGELAPVPPKLADHSSLLARRNLADVLGTDDDLHFCP